MSDQYNVKLKLLAAFRHLLVPLVRILVRNGVPFNEFAEVVKSVYANVTAKEFTVPDRRMSASRVAILTGLTRREVVRIFAEGDRLQRVLDSNANRVANVLQGWHNDPKYMGPYGFPRDLGFESDPSGAESFSDLVGTYGGDMAPGAMLDELLRIGAAIQLEAAGLIRVTKRTFIPEGFDPEMIEVFARGVRRYVETIDHNIRESVPERRRFERWVYPDHGISEKDWVAFRDMVHDRLQEVIEDLDTRFTLFARPDESKESVMSVGVGLYLYKDEVGDEQLFSSSLADLDDAE